MEVEAWSALVMMIISCVSLTLGVLTGLSIFVFSTTIGTIACGVISGALLLLLCFGTVICMSSVLMVVFLWLLVLLSIHCTLFTTICIPIVAIALPCIGLLIISSNVIQRSYETIQKTFKRPLPLPVG